MNRQKESDVRSFHAQELKKIHQQSEKLKQTEKDNFQKQIQQVKNTNKEVLSNEREKFLTEKIRQESTYFNLLDRNNQVFESNLETQKEDFKKQAEVNRSINEQVIQNQNEILKRALVRQKLEHVESFNKYENVSEDPFYKVPHFEALLKEDENKYTFTAKIPEHEMKNVDVRVQKDQISLTGKREFSENIESSDKSHKIQSNNYQSFRQDFKLGHPAYERAVTQNYEDGLLTVVVPKIGRLPSKS